jgi:hypothetical protein
MSVSELRCRITSLTRLLGFIDQAPEGVLVRLKDHLGNRAEEKLNGRLRVIKWVAYLHCCINLLGLHRR